MRIRPTQIDDLPQLLQIYETARRFMVETGNGGQWVDGYPKEELLLEDIASERSYVCLDGDNGIVGTFYFRVGEEPTYLEIFDGAWLDDAPYGVIHRIASSGKRKGVAQACIAWCLEQCGNIGSIPIATTGDAAYLNKIGFSYCGIIYLKTAPNGLPISTVSGHPENRISRIGSTFL